MEVLHYNLDMTPESEWKIVSAGPFARDNLLYLQEAGHFISGVNYYTVRKDLAQMMPEVEFTKLRRDFTMHAQGWALLRLTTDDYKHYAPVIYVQHGETLVKTTLQDIASSELRQLELDDEDEKEIRYDDYDRKERSEIELKQGAWE